MAAPALDDESGTDRETIWQTSGRRTRSWTHGNPPGDFAPRL